MSVTRWCSGCAAEAAFDRFDCVDHPESCIELVCVLCGAGIEVPPVQGADSPGRRARSAKARPVRARKGVAVA